MGLAVSQVRLLALTSRKADIELEMQIDSKRKQMLTRKSTELAQQYYNRLQNSSIQYATSDGYEDVNYSYIMGAQAGNGYSADFLAQVVYGNQKSFAQKQVSGMILTDQYGRVVVNDQMAILIQKTKDMYNGESFSSDTSNITAHALIDFINSNQNSNQAMEYVWNTINSLGNDAVKVLEVLLKNGGYQNGGIVYVNTDASSSSWNPDDDTVYYQTAENAKNAAGTETGVGVIELKDGYTYRVLTQKSAILKERQLYMDGKFWDVNDQSVQYLANLVSYFGTMISAAIKNGTTADADITSNVAKADSSGNVTISNGQVIAVSSEDSAGNVTTNYYQYTGSSTLTINVNSYTFAGSDFTALTAEQFVNAADYKVKEGGNTSYNNALSTEKLQAGFKSGVYQLVMVTDPSKGTYHRNTTLKYFTHMNYVVEKTDTSKKEEITAWFNKEQAAISEQETYWDTEITNLSTELNAVNTEIDSVKALKSNAIKSVFNWGGS